MNLRLQKASCCCESESGLKKRIPVIWSAARATFRTDGEASIDPNAGSDFWQKLLTEGHKPLRFMHLLFRYLPGPPRCKGCHNPFGGIGGKLVGLFGFTPSRKNPTLCVS